MCDTAEKCCVPQRIRFALSKQMPRVRVQRSVEIPDLLRLSRYRKYPELGPRILFFSGGTALNGLSRVLKNYTHNSIHLVTPFDSGGSSAELRRAFGMPAIGDLRARLMALADETILGHPEITELFNHRLPRDGSGKALRKEVEQLAAGKSALMKDVTSPMRSVIRNHLGYFLDAMPDDFDLRGASIGNLILTGGYLNQNQDMDPILFLFSRLVDVQGTVRAVVNDTVHLGAVLKDGREIIGQHRLTGKEVEPLSSPIDQLFLSSDARKRCDVQPKLGKKNRKLIEAADMICFPPGSFYSSLLANLLPQGVAEAVARNSNPKVYIPNLADDPEQAGHDFPALLERLLKALGVGGGSGLRGGDVLDFVLVDRERGAYPEGLSAAALANAGIDLIDVPLISKRSAPYYDNELLVQALLSLT